MNCNSQWHAVIDSRRDRQSTLNVATLANSRWHVVLKANFNQLQVVAKYCCHFMGCRWLVSTEFSQVSAVTISDEYHTSLTCFGHCQLQTVDGHWKLTANCCRQLLPKVDIMAYYYYCDNFGSAKNNANDWQSLQAAWVRPTPYHRHLVDLFSIISRHFVTLKITG